jgi:hypothetical protein
MSTTIATTVNRLVHKKETRSFRESFIFTGLPLTSRMQWPYRVCPSIAQNPVGFIHSTASEPSIHHSSNQTHQLFTLSPHFQCNSSKKEVCVERRVKGGDARRIEKHSKTVFTGFEPIGTELRKERRMTKHLCAKTLLAVLILALCSSTAFAQTQGKGPPPFPRPPVQSLLNGGYLYVLMGPSLLKYEVTDLNLTKSTTLSPPEDSAQATSTAQRPPMPPPLTMLTDGESLYLVAPGYLFKYSFDLELLVKQAMPKPDTLK